jgi:hypothetical protein
VSAARLQHAIPWAGAAIAAGTLLAAILLHRDGVDLGLRYPPFVGNFAPRATPWLLPAIACFGAAVALVPRALRARPPAFAAALFAATLVLRLVLAAARGGTEAWAHVFRATSFEGPNEYLPALKCFAYGSGFFLDRFAQLVPSLPVHAAGHPPGLLLAMHALALDTPARLAAFCIVVGAFSAPLTYALARQVDVERDARVAGGLMALAPGALLFGATSADAVYCTLGLLAAIPLAGRRPLLGGAVLGAALLFAWSLLAVLAWAAIVVLVRDGLRPALRLAILAGAAVLAVQAAFAVATGFDPLATLHATNRVYVLGIADRRPYAFWLFGSPVAFLLVLGLPIAWLALRGAAPEAVAIGAVIALSALAGFTKAETERIWLFLAPFVCLAAAPLVRRHRTVAAALAVQALAYGALMDTVW